MNKKLNPLPRLRSQVKERRFWESRDSTDYARVGLPNLKMSTTAISPRRPQGFDRIKVAVNKRDEPYLIKVWPAEKVDAE